MCTDLALHTASQNDLGHLVRTAMASLAFRRGVTTSLVDPLLRRLWGGPDHQ